MSKFTIYSGLKLVRFFLQTVFSVVLLALAVFGQTKPETDARPLAVGQPIERELKSDEAHSYSLTLQAGQFLNLVVEQKGIDVVVTLFDADGKKIIEVDSPNGTQGNEPFSLIIEKTGNYLLEVRSLEKSAPLGHYEAKMIELRVSTEKDKYMIAAQKALSEGENLRSQGTTESRSAAMGKIQTATEMFAKAGNTRQQGISLMSAGLTASRLGDKSVAIEKYNAALSLFRSISDKTLEANALNNIGEVYYAFSEKQKALEFFNQALQFYRINGDKNGEATVLGNIGALYLALGEMRKALEFFNQSLPLSRQIGDKKGEAAMLNNIGALYSALGDNQKALEFFKQSLPIVRDVGDKNGEAGILSNVSRLYNYLGDNQKALESLIQALFLIRQSGNKSDEAKILYNIGKIYEDIGENQKALEYYNQSLPLRRQVGDKKGESGTLNNIGAVYKYLGENQKALEFFKQSLPLAREVGDKNGEASTLSNIGGIYLALGEKQKALDFYNQVLLLAGQVSDKSREVIALSNIGKVYSDLGDRQKALDYYNQSLLLSREVSYRRGEATAISNIGSIYLSSGEKQKALENYNQSLPFMKQIGNKNGEAITLENLFESLKMVNSRFAIFYGKQSVNSYQILRSNVQGLNKNTQQIFLKSIEGIYRRLADALIKQQRYAEAQQVLNAFKDQQFFDFSQNKQLSPLAATARETELAETLNQKLETVVAAIRMFDGFKRGIGNRQPTDDEMAQLKSLEAKRIAANDDYLAFLKLAESEFAAPLDDKDKIPDVADLTQMQNALRETTAATKQKTVAVYQLVGEENFSAVIITDDSIRSVTVPIKSTVLNEKARQFWALLQSDKYDTTKLSKEIYDVVFKSLEKEIPRDTKTIIWSLDGNLRYLPMAALFDGKRFLAERYNHVNFTRADGERLTRAVNPNWTGTGFGTSNAQTVELLGDKISFTALPGVTEELREIFKQSDSKTGILTGAVLPDKLFTRTSFLDALRQKRPVVHIASHFSFRPGDEARSFLLLGDGSAYTLSEMKAEANLFQNVDLLTLSACNTAAAQADANGREIDGFAELAQRLGAGAVMATLWSVSDASTPWLMRDFYATKESKAGMSKAEALRRAQLALLNGTAATKPLPAGEKGLPTNKLQIVVVPNGDKSVQDKRRSEIVYIGEKNAPLYKKNDKKPFAHPYYWSPFILFGNWK